MCCKKKNERKKNKQTIQPESNKLMGNDTKHRYEIDENATFGVNAQAKGARERNTSNHTMIN